MSASWIDRKNQFDAIAAERKIWKLSKHNLSVWWMAACVSKFHTRPSELHSLSDSENMSFSYQRHDYKTILASTLWLLVTVSNVTSSRYELMVSITNQTAPLTCMASHSRSRLEASVACEGDQDCRAIWSHRTEGGQLQHGVCHCMRDPAVRSQIAELDPGLHTEIIPKFNKGRWVKFRVFILF